MVNDRVLLFGGYYMFDGEGIIGFVIMGKVFIVISYGKYMDVVGVVMVEFLKFYVYV